MSAKMTMAKMWALSDVALKVQDGPSTLLMKKSLAGSYRGLL